jgi:fucose 4-O-acetylase-like acetyltransferase
MERDLGIDWLKAFAIVLVVIGHAIQYSLAVDYDDNLLFRLIYSFHMPLFFFISGYLAYTSNKQGYLWKQIRLLVVPFVVWLLLYSLYYRRYDLQQGNWAIMPDYYLRVLRFPGSGGLWFLWALFLIDIVHYWLSKTSHFYLFSILLLVVFYVAAPFFAQVNYYGVGTFRLYYPYFLLGYFFRQRQMIEKVKLPVILLLSIAWIVSECAWHRTGDVNAFGLNIDHDADSVYAQCVRLLTPVPALILFFKLSRRFQFNSKAVQWLSMNTLAIYASHFIWIYCFTDMLCKTGLARTGFEMTLVFIVTCLFTWLTILLIRKSSFLRRLLFGR